MTRWSWGEGGYLANLKTAGKLHAKAGTGEGRLLRSFVASSIICAWSTDAAVKAE